MAILQRIFALIGLLSVAFLSVALYFDVQEMDKTEGGYEAPFEGVTGERIDWDSMDLTSTGLVRRGYVLNFIVNGTTGMISLEILGIPFEARKLSERAIVVHKPREAFIARGFSPEF
ncbi:hypothetical protein [uncultured Vibrio sp.]|uniref:hypothetical protein n=1 Tax=uncultured Vibrio sp. TaxID=114054 RepID=UPI00091579F9|nr:hypothetical protein [uncultured Vibrio sp.]OIQ26525.1 MAG: hypothetical protein BM561_01875 [Vibrio sp. MedPE-SWchi]